MLFCFTSWLKQISWYKPGFEPGRAIARGHFFFLQKLGGGGGRTQKEAHKKKYSSVQKLQAETQTVGGILSRVYFSVTLY